MSIRKLIDSKESVAILGFVVSFGIFAALLGGSWLGNVPLLLRDSAWLGIAAIGQALLMTSGEFDLSVGSVFAFTGLCFILLMQAGVGVFPALLFALLIAAAIGLLNGAITLKLAVPSLIVTLGTQFIFRGIIYVATQGFPVTIPDALRSSWLIAALGGEPLGFNNAILFFGAVAIVTAVILGKSKFGNHVCAVGADPRSALSCGISPARTRAICFVACAALAGLAGITSACYFNSVSPTTTEGLAFETIAAAVIGGCSLRGGVGSVWGTVLGAITLTVLRAGLVMLGIDIFLYQILLGIVLVALVAIKTPLGNLAWRGAD